MPFPDFREIPSELLTPGAFVEVDGSGALSDRSIGKPRKALLIGPAAAGATVADNEPVRIIRAREAVTYHGAGSILAQMADDYRALDPRRDLYTISAEVSEGTASVHSLTLSGTASVSGTFARYIAGELVTVEAASGDTAAEVASALKDAIVARSTLPVVATVTDAVVTLTHRAAGAFGDELLVYSVPGRPDPAGITAAETIATAGVGTPDLTAVFDALAADQYDWIGLAYHDDAALDLVDAELARRFGAMVAMDSRAFAAQPGHLVAVTTASGDRNSPHLALVGAQQSPTPSWRITAQVTAARMAQDGYGYPLGGTVLPRVLAPASADRLTRGERDVLLRDGVSTLKVDASGRVAIERIVSTYTTDPSTGASDITWRDLSTSETLGYLRWDWIDRIGHKYRGYKLGKNGVAVDPDVKAVTPKLLEAEAVIWFREHERRGLVQDVAGFKRDLHAQLDGTDPNRINLLMPPDLVGKFLVLATDLAFRL
ncbi:MAG: hypothetical protein KC543_10100 [Myxococcales bacterium]|nr:hypothetical protein [Myxococcales bacterium]